MWWFTSTAAMLASNRGKLIFAESRLLEYAQKIGQSTGNNKDNNTYTMTVMDTEIPSSVLPLKKNYQQGKRDTEEKLFIHSALVIRDEKKSKGDKEDTTTSSSTPLVLLHGYMNGALYFYKNLAGLAGYFTTVHSLDMLGCGLSSRADYRMLTDRSVETTESFFVESLEAWRSQNNIEKMVLAGHSMGGYMAIAYSEKYPNRVEKLVLLSPAGIQELNEDKLQSFLSSMSWTRRGVLKVVQSIYDYGVTPGALFRSVSEARGRSWVESYVSGRLSHCIKDTQEQQAVADYLYCSSILPPGIGENALSRILASTTIAHKPMIHRIPSLKVPIVAFLYGDRDWMDIEGGIDVQRKCEDKKRQYSSSSTRNPTPSVEVYQTKDAGHLLMLENAEQFNNGVILACGGRNTISSSSSSSPSLPRKIDPSTWQQGGADHWKKEENEEDEKTLSSSTTSQ